MVAKIPQNTALATLLAQRQGTGFSGFATKKPAATPAGVATAEGPENTAPQTEETPVVAPATTENTTETPVVARVGAPHIPEHPIPTDPEPLVPHGGPVTPFIPPLPVSFPPLGSNQPTARKPVGQVAGGVGKGTLDLAGFDAIKETMLGPQSRVGFSVEKQVHKWVTTESAKKGIPAAAFWREALSTEVTPEWWAAHFDEQITPGSYLRARHKAHGRVRTTTDIPTGLLDQIEETRQALLEAFGSAGPLTRGVMLETLIVKWALEMPEREAKKAAELAQADQPQFQQRGTAS